MYLLCLQFIYVLNTQYINCWAILETDTWETLVDTE